MSRQPTATVNGITYKTVIDEHGVQRFCKNRIVRDLLDAAIDGKVINLNKIAVDVANGRYSADERRELYRLIGYSVGGYCECFEDDEVESSLWK